MSEQSLLQLIDLCQAWGHTFPRRAWDDGEHRAAVASISQWMRDGRRHMPHYAFPQFGDRAPRWRELGDTGVGDTTDHALEVLDDLGFELAMDDHLDFGTGPSGGQVRCWVLLHRTHAVLAQLEGTHHAGRARWEVDDFRFWGCGAVEDHELFVGLYAGGRRLADDHPLLGSLESVEIGRAAHSARLAWLTACAALTWVGPWPEPLVHRLGPGSPALGADMARTTRVYHHNTNAIIARLPDRVHARLGTITAGRLIQRR